MVKGTDGYVEKKTNKTQASTRLVPIIVPQLRSVLMAQKKKTGRLVTRSQAVLFSDVNKICRETGLPEVGIHGLRHSFASLCHHLGVPVMEAAKMGGWADIGTMQKIYTHLSADDMSNATELLTAFFETAK